MLGNANADGMCQILPAQNRTHGDNACAIASTNYQHATIPLQMQCPFQRTRGKHSPMELCCFASVAIAKQFETWDQTRLAIAEQFDEYNRGTHSYDCKCNVLLNANTKHTHKCNYYFMRLLQTPNNLKRTIKHVLQSLDNLMCIIETRLQTQITHTQRYEYHCKCNAPFNAHVKNIHRCNCFVLRLLQSPNNSKHKTKQDLQSPNNLMNIIAARIHMTANAMSCWTQTRNILTKTIIILCVCCKHQTSWNVRSNTSCNRLRIWCV